MASFCPTQSPASAGFCVRGGFARGSSWANLVLLGSSKKPRKNMRGAAHTVAQNAKNYFAQKAREGFNSMFLSYVSASFSCRQGKLIFAYILILSSTMSQGNYTNGLAPLANQAIFTVPWGYVDHPARTRLPRSLYDL